MKNIIMIFVVFTFSYSNLFAHADLSIGSGSTDVYVTMKIKSIPFEGLNKDKPYNRYNLDFNGSKHRRYSYENPNIHWDYPITLFEGNSIYACSCWYEEPQGSPIYGFAIYEITITPTEYPDKAIMFYFNTLDSKLGTESVNVPGYQGKPYHADLQISYTYHPVKPFVTIKSEACQWIIPQNVDFNEQGKEIKIWNLFFELNEPLGKDFQARTTPFPINSIMLHDNYNMLKELKLGTTVTLGGVYNNVGGHDIWGYNTINTYPYDYYGNPPIEGQNDPGNTFCTPAWGDDFNYGMIISAESGDKLIITDNKKLWVSGKYSIYSQSWEGDELSFEAGSNLEKGAYAQINTCRGGRLVDYGATTSWGWGSWHAAYANSSIEYYGPEHTINNGRIQILGEGKLIIGDNTTLIFDGERACLFLEPNSTVILGNNAKIIFRNGAWFCAVNATFNSSSPSTYWEGLVFENAGTQYGISILHSHIYNARNPISIYNNSQASLQFLSDK